MRDVRADRMPPSWIGALRRTALAQLRAYHTRISARRDEEREHDPVVGQMAEQLEPAEHRQRDREQHRADSHDRTREMAGHDGDPDHTLSQASTVRARA